jgi:transposase-like protein
MKLRRRPALGVSLEAIERELLDKCGSVSAAARALGVSSIDLRRLVGSRPLLAYAVYEGTERAIDEAVQVLRDGMRRPELSQRLAAAAFFLRHTEAGRRRGWGTDRKSCRKTEEPQDVALKWIDT